MNVKLNASVNEHQRIVFYGISYLEIAGYVSINQMTGEQMLTKYVVSIVATMAILGSSSARSQINASMNVSEIVVQIEDFTFRRPDGISRLVPRIPDISITIPPSLIGGEENLSQTIASRIICFPGDPEVCFGISITAEHVQSISNAANASSSLCSAGGFCSNFTTFYMHMDEKSILVAAGPSFTGMQLASSLGWEVSCTVGMSGGRK
ncbi:MAG TPA: hypothetical protein VEY95_07010 [Azospirillaceae bacterium]|nr:hypothetical protein [Azospirillaceae bacterium]